MEGTSYVGTDVRRAESCLRNRSLAFGLAGRIAKRSKSEMHFGSLAFAIHGTESCPAPVVAVNPVQSHSANPAGALGRQTRCVGLE